MKARLPLLAKRGGVVYSPLMQHCTSVYADEDHDCCSLQLAATTLIWKRVHVMTAS